MDCLSRAAMFDQAEELIDEYEHDHAPIYAMYSEYHLLVLQNSMFVSMCAVALLSGARNYKNGPLAERIVLRMKKLFGDMKDVLISASILLANVYGSLGNIDRASDIRTELNRTGGKKPVGMSWTAPDGPVDVSDDDQIMSRHCLFRWCSRNFAPMIDLILVRKKFMMNLIEYQTS